MICGANEYGIWYVVVFDISFSMFVLLRLLMLQSCPLLDPFLSSFRFLWSDPLSMLWVFWTYLKAWGFYMESQVIWGSFVDRSFIPSLGSQDIKETIHSWDIEIPCHDPLVFLCRPHSTDLLTGALQLTSLRRGEVPKVSLTWDTLVPWRWWHEDTSSVESGTLEVFMLPTSSTVERLMMGYLDVFSEEQRAEWKWLGDGSTFMATKLHCIRNMIMPDKRASQRTEGMQIN